MITLPDTYQLLHFETLDSTNEEAKRLAAQGVVQPHWILADTQSAGRGRRGRVWQSPKGNLMTTVYQPGRIETEKAGQLSFVAGLALADTVSSLIGPDGAVSIKWPNDVLVGGAKISGILLESGAASDAHLDWVCVGMGLNLAHFPDNTPYLATSIAAHTGHRPENLAVLEVWLRPLTAITVNGKILGSLSSLQSGVNRRIIWVVKLLCVWKRVS